MASGQRGVSKLTTYRATDAPLALTRSPSPARPHPLALTHSPSPARSRDRSPLTVTVGGLDRATYKTAIQRNLQYYQKFPEDFATVKACRQPCRLPLQLCSGLRLSPTHCLQLRVAPARPQEVVAALAGHEGGGWPLPAGGRLSPRRFLQLGMGLGMSGGKEQTNLALPFVAHNPR